MVPNEGRNKAGPDRSLNSSAGIELRGMVLGCSLCSAYFREQDCNTVLCNVTGNFLCKSRNSVTKSMEPVSMILK